MEFEEEELREFETFVRELIPNISATDYVNFDTGISTSKPMINELEIDTTKRYAKIFYVYINKSMDLYKRNRSLESN